MYILPQCTRIYIHPIHPTFADTLCNMITCNEIKVVLIKENILGFLFEILNKFTVSFFLQISLNYHLIFLR